METSLKTGFAQIFLLPQKTESPKIWGGAAAPLAPRPVRLWRPSDFQIFVGSEFNSF